jgi:hypothetical protein
MKILFNGIKRVLLQDNDKEIDISDGQIVKYEGNNYKSIFEKIETYFIGKVVNHRSNFEDGVTGIYLEPLYILIDNEWCKISNYEQPKSKYFYYPHLLMLPNIYYHHVPIYSLHTIENENLNNFSNVTKNYSLEYKN